MNTRATSLILLGACLVVLWTTRGSAAAPLHILDPADPRPDEVRALHDDIALANLVLGLNLTGDQLVELARIAREADDVRVRHTETFEPVLAEMEDSFAVLRDHLLGGGEPPDDVKHRAQRAQNAFQEFRVEVERELVALEAEAREVLDEGQACIIEEFKPCLIPPADLASPARVGQAGASEHLVRLLGELRTLPDNTYARRQERFREGTLERMEWHHGPQSDEEAGALLAEVDALLDEVRAMHDLQWDLQGQAMADRLQVLVLGEDRHPRDRGELTAVGRFLLAPGSADVIGAIAGQ